VGGFIGPFVLGKLSDRADGGFTAAMLLLGTFLCVSGSLILLFPAPGRRPDVKERSSDVSESLRAAAAAEEDGEEDGGMGMGGSGSGIGSGGLGGSAALNGAGSCEAVEQQWGSSSMDGAEGEGSWRRQQQRERERLRGSSAAGSTASEVECQPILPAGTHNGHSA